MTTIEIYKDEYRQAIIDLILHIQQVEYGVPVQLSDQPDLQTINEVYWKNDGGFWVALHEGQVVGTVGLIDFGNHGFALRKMFVRKEYRGNEYGIGKSLLQKAMDWCREKKAAALYLGTHDQLKAAIRFYEKHGFTQIRKEDLPAAFPLMQVDTVFFRYQFF